MAASTGSSTSAGTPSRSGRWTAARGTARCLSGTRPRPSGPALQYLMLPVRYQAPPLRPRALRQLQLSSGWRRGLLNGHFVCSSNSSPGAVPVEGRHKHLFSLLPLLVMEVFPLLLHVLSLERGADKTLISRAPHFHCSLVKLVSKYSRFGTKNQEFPSRRLAGRGHKTNTSEFLKYFIFYISVFL